MSIPKKLRFDVFKRDAFTCQYCGKKAPDVVLHCDHIEPEASGGATTLLNLITACSECNLGKGARHLSDDSALAKQREQLTALQERKEQLEMMMQWQHSLVDIEDETVNELAAYWCRVAEFGGKVTPVGKATIRKLLRRSGAVAVMEAMLAAAERYIVADASGSATFESAQAAFGKIDGVLTLKREEIEKPYLKDLFYVRAIVRNRFDQVNIWRARAVLEEAFVAGADVEVLKDIAKGATSYTDWLTEMEGYVSEIRGRF